jgi:hypothetical protein
VREKVKKEEKGRRREGRKNLKNSVYKLLETWG